MPEQTIMSEQTTMLEQTIFSRPAVLKESSIDVIGAPYSFGQPLSGADTGPQRMRDAGLRQKLENHGFTVRDRGDIRFDTLSVDPTVHKVHNPKQVGAANFKIAEAVTKSLRCGSRCVLLGGDHSMAIGSIIGHAEYNPDIGIIWVDAHADLNPPLESPSGNAHGMPLAFLVRELKDRIPGGIPGFEWVKPCLSFDQLVYIGLRDLDDPEEKIIDKYNVKAFRMADVKARGIEEIVEAAINHLGSRRKIHLSFDIDSLDPEYARSTGTPVTGGLTLDQGIYIAKTIAETGRLEMMDMAEVNPQLGSLEDQETTLESACSIIEAAFGESCCRRIESHGL